MSTVSQVGRSAGAEMTPKAPVSIEIQISEVVLEVVDAWRRRGLDGNVSFSGRSVPARLTLGVLSMELVVHGWDFARALRRPLPITSTHADHHSPESSQRGI